MDGTLNKNAQAVLDAVKCAGNHPTALDIYTSVKQVRPGIGLASIYRILHTLTQQGHIKELGRSAECCRYDAHLDRHDHAVCIECGVLLDVPMEIPLPSSILQAAASAAGIELTSHELRLYGRCPSCIPNKQA